VDIEKTKRENGVRVALLESIDLVHTLSYGTIEKVEATVKERVWKNRFKSIKTCH
jgi:hypothetical protein